MATQPAEVRRQWSQASASQPVTDPASAPAQLRLATGAKSGAESASKDAVLPHLLGSLQQVLRAGFGLGTAGTASNGRSLRLGHFLADFTFSIVNAWTSFGILLLVSRQPGESGSWLAQFISIPFRNECQVFLLLQASFTLLICRHYELYDARQTRSRLEGNLAIIKAVFATSLFLTIFADLTRLWTVSLWTIILSGLLNLATFIGWRAAHRKWIESRVEAGKVGRCALIVGANPLGERLANWLESNKHWGYVVRGFLDEEHSSNGLKILGRIENLSAVARAEFADEIFVALPGQRALVRKVVEEARNHNLSIKVVADSYDSLAWSAPINYVGDIPVFSLHEQPIPFEGRFVKRTLDLIGSLIGLILLCPVFALIALAIKLDSSGPVFYRSLRVGKKGRKFIFLKFRSMVVNAEELKEQLRSHNERKGLLFKMSNDPRVTRLGRFLRKYSLDELPQLWNVLTGDMSLVGPRPPSVDEFEQYCLEHLRRLSVVPGITGIWQIKGRSDPSFDTAMAFDIQYIRNWSPWLDVKILLQTIPTVLKGTGC